MVWGSGYNMVQCSVHSATVASVVLLSAIHETYRKASTCLQASILDKKRGSGFLRESVRGFLHSTWEQSFTTNAREPAFGRAVSLSTAHRACEMESSAV